MSKAPNYFTSTILSSRLISSVTTDILIKPQLFRTSSCTLQLLRCRDLDLGPMTFKLNCDLDILKMYHRTEKDVAK